MQKKRIKLTIAYDGTNYCGWQVQPNGITVEEVINKALCKLTGEDIAVIGASRTDSGVHALGNVAVFDSATSIPPERIAMALNQRLPDDIVIVKSEEVARISIHGIAIVRKHTNTILSIRGRQFRPSD